MLKNVVGIRICGANYSIPTDLLFFKPDEKDNNNKDKNVKATLIYGRNGTGKSTISKSIRKIAGDDIPHISQAVSIDFNGNEVILTEDEKRRIFVFDEDFIDHNVRFQNSGLNTIVMLGQQGELAEQIKIERQNLTNANAEYQAQKEIMSRYLDPNNENSPAFWINKMKVALQGDANWAGRDRIIRNKRQNTKVSDDTYSQFVGIVPSKTRDQLIVEFDDTLKKLRIAQNGDDEINPAVPTVHLAYDESHIMELLSRIIEKPELSEREKYLLQLSKNGYTDRVEEIKTTFEDESIESCPFCFQPVTLEYKKNVVESVKKILSRIYEEHRFQLKQVMLQEVSIDFTPYEKLTSLKMDCSICVEQINKAILGVNEVIQKKYDDPYTPVTIEMSQLSALLEKLSVLLKKLELARKDYNKNVVSAAPYIEKLNNINREIAHYDIIEFKKRYDEQYGKYELVIRTTNEKSKVIDNCQKIVDELEAKRKNVKIALEVINNCMKYIFFSDTRLKIEYKDEEYVLLSNGHPVKPSEVSLGERNIIGLCYFFANILQNQEMVNAYKQEYLLVIDDPVSSFDTENKIGIMSFLKLQLARYLEGNKDTRVIVTTHDIMTYYDLTKIYDEILDQCKQTILKEKLSSRQFELKSNKLTQFSKNRQEYTELLKMIYNYANGQGEEHEIVIGNMMRQVLEAFATFQYKKAIDKVSIDQQILQNLGDEAYRSYFYNLMYRLVLHGGSHREDQVKSLDDMNFFSIISSTDKKRTARDILCFMYLLNELHILSHLKDEHSAKSNLSQWCSEIKRRSAVI